MKIILINPRYDERQYRYRVNKLVPPLGMGYIASVLLQRGHSVKVLDMEALQMEFSELPGYLEKERPEVVGVHGTTPISQFIAQCVRTVRGACSEAVIVVGGPHATLLPESVLEEMPEADYVLRGEAEYSMAELAGCIARGAGEAEYSQIPGICFRSEGRSIISSTVPRIEDLDELPFPAYGLLPMDAYYESGTEERVCTIMSTRGCNGTCIFCCEPVLYGSKFRARAARSVVDEVEVLNREHGIDHIIFYDASFINGTRRVERICNEMIDRGLRVTWRARVRADKISESMVSLMKKAGCVSLSIGVESGSQRLLDVLNKRCHIEEIENAFQIIGEAGLWSVGYFMFGIPGETLKDCYQTIEFAKRLDPDWALFSVATPLPKTRFYEMVKGNLTTNNWSKFKCNANSPVVSYDGLTDGELRQVVDDAYKSFYLSEKWLVNRLKKAKTPGKMERIVKSFFFYMTKKDGEDIVNHYEYPMESNASVACR